MSVPDELADKPFVRVFAAQDKWYGLTPDGKVVNPASGTDRWDLPEFEKPVVDMVLGRMNHFALHADGSFTQWAQHEKYYGPPPDGLKRVRGFAAANGNTIALLMNGGAHVFGRTLIKEGGGRYNDRANVLGDVKLAATDSQQCYFVTKENEVIATKVLNGEKRGGITDGLEGKNIIATASPCQGYGCLFLTDKGKVYSAGGAPRPPADLPPARQIRFGAQIGAAQMGDGTWRI